MNSNRKKATDNGLPIRQAQGRLTTDNRQRRDNGQRTTDYGQKNAFSLVEISLAMLVIAVGILSVLSLFPVGLDQSVRSSGDTHAALFAQEVFSGLRAQAETNWANLGDAPVICAASNMWNFPLTNQITGTDVMTNVYKWSSYVDHAHRYRLTISTNDKLTIKSAMLRVYPGEFGSIGNPIVFYTEFYKFSQ